MNVQKNKEPSFFNASFSGDKDNVFSIKSYWLLSHGLAHIHIQRNSERNKCWIQVKELVLSNVFGPVKFQKGWYEYYVISSAAV